MKRIIILLLTLAIVLFSCTQQQRQKPTDDIFQEEPSAVPETPEEVKQEIGEEAAEEPAEDIAPAPTGSDESELLKSGSFFSVAKSVKGQVSIYRRQTDDEIVFALRSFRTDPGAKLYFFLVENSVEDGYKVGGLQNIYGNYEYIIPRNVPVERYNKVILYSESTKEVYGEAKLS